jgi:hypothetical protein
VDRLFCPRSCGSHPLRGLARPLGHSFVHVGHYLVPRFVQDLFVGSFFVTHFVRSLVVCVCVALHFSLVVCGRLCLSVSCGLFVSSRIRSEDLGRGVLEGNFCTVESL